VTVFDAYQCDERFVDLPADFIEVCEVRLGKRELVLLCRSRRICRVLERMPMSSLIRYELLSFVPPAARTLIAVK